MVTSRFRLHSEINWLYSCFRIIITLVIKSTYLLTRLLQALLEACNSSNATYLFQQDKHYDVSYDTGDKAIQCGRHNDVFKLWLMWRAKGDSGIEEQIERLMDLSRSASDQPTDWSTGRLTYRPTNYSDWTTNRLTKSGQPTNHLIDWSTDIDNCMHHFVPPRSGPFNYYVTLFWPILTPPPSCHKVSHWPEPPPPSPRNVTLVCRPSLTHVMLKSYYK